MIPISIHSNDKLTARKNQYADTGLEVPSRNQMESDAAMRSGRAKFAAHRS
jgi:hypothetical protein